MARLWAGGLYTALALFVLVLVVLFHGVFVPGQTLFSNDGPLGELMARCHHLPERFFGCWSDLNNVGFNGGAASPSLSFGLQWLLGPLWFSKFYAISSLLILGTGAWCFLRQSKLSPPACILGGLAAMLNSTFFSVACWGVGAHAITAGMTFFALAALADPAAPRRWLRVVLAGMALGMAVTEGADVGAIFSFYAAAYIIYQAWATPGAGLKSFAGGFARLALVAVCAGFLAAQSLHGLIDTSIRGVKGAQQDAETKAGRWDWATQWSLPKVEAVNLVVPGIFGYRMDDLNSATYWGRMGRAPAWDKYIDNGRQGPPPKGFIRYSGGGNYAGAFVFLLAFWAVAESLRRKDPVFTPAQRRWVWFWLGAGLISFLLALGRFAPFYKYVYTLPYFSTVRNPTKFIYPFGFSLVVLSALGVHGLCRRYLQPAAPGSPSRWPGLRSWWNGAARLEKNWTYGWAATALALLIGWGVYAAHRADLVQYLQGVQIGASPDLVADYSIAHAGWLPAVVILGGGLMILIFSRAFTGRLATRGAICLGLLLAGDLALANYPWVHYWNYQEKYDKNAILDVLEDQPYQHRVAVAPIEQSKPFAPFFKLYKLEWMQHEFPYNNIQAFETVEMPRMPLDYAAFSAAVNATNGAPPWFHLTRAWQLTATGYILAPVGLADYLVQQNIFAQPPLQLVTQFRLERKPGVLQAKRPDEVTVVPASDGPYALYRFLPALARATLFSNWQTTTNDAAALAQLIGPGFDPSKNVLVDGIGPASSPSQTNAAPGSVAIINYAPKDIVLQADARSPAILLLSDHYEADWKVFVDGRPDTLLRCDFLLRGVHLEPGTHRVEFKFQPSTGWLGVSVAAVLTALLVLVVLALQNRKGRPAAPATAVATPVPAAAPPKAERRPDNRKKAPGNRAVKH
jgi:hypothetical protein